MNKNIKKDKGFKIRKRLKISDKRINTLQFLLLKDITSFSALFVCTFPSSVKKGGLDYATGKLIMEFTKQNLSLIFKKKKNLS